MNSNIVLFDEYTYNEIYISKMIKTIHDFREHFNIIDSYRLVSYTDNNNINNNILDVYDLYDNKNKQYLLITKPNIEMYPNIIEFFNEYITIKNNTSLLYFIEFYIDILNSISILDKNYIIHFGINIDNIYITNDSINYTTIISNFNNSLNKRKNKIKYIIHKFVKQIDNNSYTFYPIEIYLLHFLHDNPTKKLNISIIESICKTYISTLFFFDTLFSKKFIKQYYDLCISHTIKYINYTNENIINDILQTKIISTWDNFSLSCVYLSLIDSMFLKKEMSQFIILFSQILLKNIHPNVEVRYIIDDNIELFKNLINNSNVNFK
jgi:hypothetical protein